MSPLPTAISVLYAAEESGFVGRNFLKSHRPLTLKVVDLQGQLVFESSRSFFWFFSHLHVRDSARPLGSLRRQFGVVVRKFTLEDSTGCELAEIRGPQLRPNTFMLDRQGSEIVRITKQWIGIVKEAFTDADTFRLEFNNWEMGPDFTLLVLATAFSFDLDFFES